MKSVYLSEYAKNHDALLNVLRSCCQKKAEPCYSITSIDLSEQRAHRVGLENITVIRINTRSPLPDLLSPFRPPLPFAPPPPVGPRLALPRIKIVHTM